MSMAATADRAYRAMSAIIGEVGPAPARYTTMRVVTVVEQAMGVTGLNGIAVGTGPGGETVTALYGETPPVAGELWRVVAGEMGTPWLDDLIR